MVKVDIISDNELVIYLYNNINGINFKEELCVKNFLKDLFVKLNDYYDIKIEGYYDVDVYIDEIYGIVLDLVKDDIDFYDYYSNTVDMKIIIKRCKFLYLVEDYDIDFKKFYVYKLVNNVYLLPKIKLNYIELGSLIENSKVIYNSDDIVKKAIKINC